MKAERATCQMASRWCRDEEPVAIIRGTPACRHCVAWYEQREPNDEQMANAPGVEGGVRYPRGVPRSAGDGGE